MAKNTAGDDNKLCPKSLIVEYGSLAHILGEPFKIFSKFVKLLDLYFVATTSSPDKKLLHGAYVLYQYIDNDGDGKPDNKEVYDQLVGMKATMVMFKDQKESERNSSFFDKVTQYDVLVQDLEADETNPHGKFDEALEECFHLLTQGYVKAYPDVFGDNKGTYVANCCDAARGGYFPTVPKCYPAGAWFTYYDETCDYGCQIDEYLYWAMTSILGAQKSRPGILHEWRLNTPELVFELDLAIYALLTNDYYKLPKKIPRSPFECAGQSFASKCKKRLGQACIGCFPRWTIRSKYQ